MLLLNEAESRSQVQVLLQYKTRTTTKDFNVVSFSFPNHIPDSLLSLLARNVGSKTCTDKAVKMNQYEKRVVEQKVIAATGRIVSRQQCDKGNYVNFNCVRFFYSSKDVFLHYNNKRHFKFT